MLSPAPPVEPEPTEDTIHLPAIEAGAEEQPAVEPEGDVPPVGITQGQPSPEESEQVNVAGFIDGLAVLLGYGWLACGVLLLLAVPVGLYLFDRWGHRRRSS